MNRQEEFKDFSDVLRASSGIQANVPDGARIGNPVPLVTFTSNLQRHTPCPPCSVPGDTVREALESAFGLYPRARGYVMDEHGALRHHMVVFVNGRAVEDRRTLNDPVSASSEIFVAQALSGG